MGQDAMICSRCGTCLDLSNLPGNARVACPGCHGELLTPPRLDAPVSAVTPIVRPSAAMVARSRRPSKGVNGDLALKACVLLGVLIGCVAWLSSGPDDRPPQPKPNPADDVRAAEYFAQQAARDLLVQRGIVPTSASWPRETRHSARWEDEHSGFPRRYLVEGTAESHGRVVKWSTLVMHHGNGWQGCFVTCHGLPIWMNPAYRQKIKTAEAIAAKQAIVDAAQARRAAGTPDPAPQPRTTAEISRDR